jgi:hypothetical protein
VAPVLAEGFHPEARNALRVLIEAARREGWDIRELGSQQGIVSVAATSPGGGFCFACPEDELLDRLRVLLLKR